MFLLTVIKIHYSLEYTQDVVHVANQLPFNIYILYNGLKQTSQEAFCTIGRQGKNKKHISKS